MAQLSKKKMMGLLLCLGAVVIVASGWAYARSNETFTDNAYIRGDMTSLAPKCMPPRASLSTALGQA